MILVTGGSGFVGREVVQALVQHGLPVRILTRKTIPLPYPGVEVVTADVRRPETLASAFAGVTAVIHLVGIIFEDQSTFEEAHTQVTANVLAAAKNANPSMRFVHLSSIGTRPNAVSRYHITKWEAEELVRKSGLPWTIFRASLIYGHDERDRIFLLIARLINPPLSWLFFRSFAVLGGGRSQIQPVSVRHVAQCLVKTLSTASTHSQTIDLVGPTPVTFIQMVTKIAEAQKIGVLREPVGLPIVTSVRAALYLYALAGPFVIFLLKFAPTNNISMMAATNLFNPTPIEWGLLAALWLVSLIVLFAWRSLIIFSVPVFAAALGSKLFGFSEQFKMATEDNIGDPSPATKLLGLTNEPLDQALRGFFQ